MQHIIVCKNMHSHFADGSGIKQSLAIFSFVSAARLGFIQRLLIENIGRGAAAVTRQLGSCWGVPPGRAERGERSVVGRGLLVDADRGGEAGRGGRGESRDGDPLRPCKPWEVKAGGRGR